MCILCRSISPFIASSDDGSNTALCSSMLLCRNGHLCTPLDLAADKGHAEVISLLIKADAPLETKDKSGVSKWDHLYTTNYSTWQKKLAYYG